jgi:phage terminase large subunit-like protein
MTTLAEPVLLGSQEPTYLWVPDYTDTLGGEAIELYQTCGGALDKWQRLALDVAFALDPDRVLLCFEIAIIVSRQNGKGEVLLALELAWLFLFGEKLIIHSAHLFETSREHFLKMAMLIQSNPDMDRQVAKMREGRGAEEIILKSGARLKFMTRKGGASRGFTGSKLVCDEAMYLDATMMSAGVPTMATRPEAQIVYAGSAGFKHSTQLAAVRRRGHQARRGREYGDPALALLEWAADKAVYDEHGNLIGGDDPADPRTHAKVNPALGVRISHAYVRREARALGGFDSVEFGTERLGIGDWPEDDERWEVIDKPTWQAAADRESVLDPAGVRVLAVDADPMRGVTTLGVTGVRADGRRHIEVIARHRGSLWVVEKLLGTGVHDVYGELDLWERLGKPTVVILKNGPAAELIGRLRAGRPRGGKERKVTVESPTEQEYAAACADLVEGVRVGDLVHIDQASMNAAVGAAAKRENTEGGWRWAREVTADQAPIVAGTLGVWKLAKNAKIPRSKVW